MSPIFHFLHQRCPVAHLQPGISSLSLSASGLKNERFETPFAGVPLRASVGAQPQFMTEPVEPLSHYSSPEIVLVRKIYQKAKDIGKAGRDIRNAQTTPLDDK
jgi:hypothetical protein